MNRILKDDEERLIFSKHNLHNMSVDCEIRDTYDTSRYHMKPSNGRNVRLNSDL